MKIFLYDKFLDSLIKLPKNTQKKVLEFQKKFRTNSKSAAIHLEPISTFKDSTLRSARIDKTYRAILKMVDSANYCYLMWVDHHDKAYQWAENKEFIWNDQTQSLQIFELPKGPLPPKDKQSSGMVPDLFSNYSDQDLSRVGVPDILLPSVRSLKHFNDLDTMEDFLPPDVFENLFYLADGANIESIITEVEEGRINSGAIEDQQFSLNNQRSFIELTDDSLLNEVLTGSLEKWKYFLHPSQRLLVSKQLKGPMKITGGAGTGKTVAALHRLKHLSKTRNAGEKILFTTYTNALKENIKELTSGLEIEQQNIDVFTIDHLVFKLCKDFSLVSDQDKVIEFSKVKQAKELWDIIIDSHLVEFDRDFLIKEYKGIILYHNIKTVQDYYDTSRAGMGKPISRRKRKDLWALFSAYDALKKEFNYLHKEELYNYLRDFLVRENTYLYDYVIIDELQDFSNVELRLLRALVPEKPNDLFMVGDPMQKIYDRRINFSSVGINIRGKRSRRLRINYRTTEEIRKLAVAIIHDCSFDDFDGSEEQRKGYLSLYHGPNPSYRTFKTKDKEVDFVISKVNEIISRGYKYSDIVICSRSRLGLKDFVSGIHKAALPYSQVVNGKWIGNDDGLKLLTFHGIKGLEFKHVFLTDVNEKTAPFLAFGYNDFPDSKKYQIQKSEKSLLYVAMTRAKESVSISGVGHPSKIIRLDTGGS